MLRRAPPPQEKELDRAHTVSQRQKPPDDRRDSHSAESTTRAIASSQQIRALGAPAGAGCTTFSCRMHERSGTRAHREHCRVRRSVSSPARNSRPLPGNEREPGRSMPGRADDLRCRSSAADPGAPPCRRRSRLAHRVPVVHQVQDDEADERATSTSMVQPESNGWAADDSARKSTARDGSPHANRANCTSDHYKTQLRGGGR